MSIASEITRLGSLRDIIRSKLISAGIISNESAKLSDCASAIDEMTVNSKVSKVLDTSTTSVAIPKGYHKEAGTVSISAQEKTQNISSGTATVTPDSGKVLKKVTVNGPTSYADTTQFASSITQDDDNTYFAVPKAGYYNTGSKIAAKNSNLISDGYLFKDGKLPITGDWLIKNQSGGSITIDDKISIIQTGGATGTTQVFCVTEKAIDLTDYNWIAFKPYPISGYTVNSHAHLGLFDANDWDGTNWNIIDKTNGTYDYGAAVQCLDISNRSGSFYIGIYSWYEAPQAYDIKEIVLLK